MLLLLMSLLMPPSVTETNYMVLLLNELKIGWISESEVEHRILQDKEVTVSYEVNPITHRARVMTNVKFLEESL